MALFRRNKSTAVVSSDVPAVPEEVASYYQAEKRDRTWMAWLLALLSLAVTALVVMALFFGGRWIYRKIRHNSAPSTPISGDSANKSPAASNSYPSNSGDKPSATTDPNKDKASVNAPSNPAPSTNPNPSTGSSTPATTTSPPNNNSNLPKTGPGDVVAVFVLSSVAGAMVHRYVLRPKNV